MSSVSTAISGVYVSPSVLPVFNQYLSCAAAKELLSSDNVVKPLFIEATRDQNFAETQSFFNKNYKPTKLKILIPESHLRTNEGLGDLVFEIFNAKKRFVAQQAYLMKEAAAGNLSMDAFARSTEINELNNAHEHAELRRECQALKLPPDEVVDHLKDKPREVALFAQDTDCHTDIYRADWIDLYQAAYCAQHPSDTRSCKAGKNELCDRNQLLGMPEQKRNKIYKERICRMFADAHQDVKSDFVYQKFVKNHCPKSQKERTQTEL